MDFVVRRRERLARLAGSEIRARALLEIEDVARRRETYRLPAEAPAHADYVEWVRILADVALCAPAARLDDDLLMWIRCTAHHRDLTLATPDQPEPVDYVELIGRFAARGRRAPGRVTTDPLARLDWLWLTTTDSQRAWVTKTLGRRGLRMEALLGSERCAEIAEHRARILAGDLV